jgi:hypothetical protein
LNRQMSQSQRDVDTTCAATMQGRHEQQLISLEKSHDNLSATLEKGQEVLRQDVGELRKDVRDLVSVITVSINDNHKESMDALGKMDDRIDVMATDVTEMKTTVVNHDKDIVFIKNVIRGTAYSTIIGSLSVLWWFVQKYVTIGGR